jgi:hypothetical protein
MKQLGGATETAGAHAGALAQPIQWVAAAGDQNVAGFFPLGDRTDAKPCGNIGGHVFHAVNCQIDAAIQQGLFNFLDEQPFATHFGQWNVEDFVPPGFYDGQFDSEVRMVALDGSLDPVGLPQGQLAAPGADGDGVAWPSVSTPGAAGCAASGA